MTGKNNIGSWCQLARHFTVPERTLILKTEIANLPIPFIVTSLTMHCNHSSLSFRISPHIKQISSITFSRETSSYSCFSSEMLPTLTANTSLQFLLGFVLKVVVVVCGPLGSSSSGSFLLIPIVFASLPLILLFLLFFRCFSQSECKYL